MLSKHQIDNIVELGRQKDSINTEELKQILPIDALTFDELIHIVEVLEAAGVSVVVDPSLLVHSDRRLKEEDADTTPSAELSSGLSVSPPIPPLATAIENAKTSGHASKARSYRVPFSVHIIVGVAVALAAVAVGVLLLA